MSYDTANEGHVEQLFWYIRPYGDSIRSFHLRPQSTHQIHHLSLWLIQMVSNSCHGSFLKSRFPMEANLKCSCIAVLWSWHWVQCSVIFVELQITSNPEFSLPFLCLDRTCWLCRQQSHLMTEKMMLVHLLKQVRVKSLLFACGGCRYHGANHKCKSLRWWPKHWRDFLSPGIKEEEGNS